MYLIMGLIVLSTVIILTTNAIAKNPIFAKHTDNSDKLDVFYGSLSKLESELKDDSNAKTSDFVVPTKSDVFLFFSKGNKNITLTYMGIETTKNSYFVFERPQKVECEDKACLCYSEKGEFIKSLEEDPYFEKANFKSIKNTVNGQKWSDQSMKCVIAPDPNSVFTNSRGRDNAKFVPEHIDGPEDNKLTSVSFETIIALFGETKDKLKTTKNKDSSNNLVEEVTEFAIKNYKWDGGVAIGGMDTIDTSAKKDRDKVTGIPYKITFEKYKYTDIIGVCLVKNCLFENAVKEEQDRIIDEDVKETATRKFNSIKSYLKTEYNLCLENEKDVDGCAVNFEFEFVKFFQDTTGSKNLYVFGFRKSEDSKKALLDYFWWDGNKRKLNLLETVVLPIDMPTLNDEEVNFYIYGQIDEHLIIDSDFAKISTSFLKPLLVRTKYDLEIDPENKLNFYKFVDENSKGAGEGEDAT